MVGVFHGKEGLRQHGGAGESLCVQDSGLQQYAGAALPDANSDAQCKADVEPESFGNGHAWCKADGEPESFGDGNTCWKADGKPESFGDGRYRRKADGESESHGHSNARWKADLQRQTCGVGHAGEDCRSGIRSHDKSWHEADVQPGPCGDGIIQTGQQTDRCGQYDTCGKAHRHHSATDDSNTAGDARRQPFGDTCGNGHARRKAHDDSNAFGNRHRDASGQPRRYGDRNAQGQPHGHCRDNARGQPHSCCQRSSFGCSISRTGFRRKRRSKARRDGQASDRAGRNTLHRCEWGSGLKCRRADSCIERRGRTDAESGSALFL